MGAEERKREGRGKGEGSMMSWAAADLLDWGSITSARSHTPFEVEAVNGDSMPIARNNDLQPPSHHVHLDNGDSTPATSHMRNRDATPNVDIVIEKSCADSIVCGEDVEIPIPYRLRKGAVCDLTATAYVHPVCLLAIHLAALTRPGAAWIALSYSESRFNCLYGEEDGDHEFRDAKTRGEVPDPGRLWRVIEKTQMVAQEEGMKGSVYQPKISHWLYVLRRTGEKVT